MQESSPQAANGLPLRFAEVLVVVGGGRCDEVLLKGLAAEGAAIVAADGGAVNVKRAGLTPAAIIGDLDSLEDPQSWMAHTRLVRIDEQESTDFEKCLYATEAPVTIALGMTGERLDHTLAALDAMARYAHGRAIVLVDEVDLAVALTGPFRFRVGPGGRVSIHPLREVTFEGSTGLVYPLEGLTLAPGVKTGTSNAASSGRFTITPASDAPWLLIVDRRYLGALIDCLLERRGVEQG